MSNLKRTILTLVLFSSWLAGFAWLVSAFRGYHFGRTLLAIVCVYAALLLAYACYRRASQKLRAA